MLDLDTTEKPSNEVPHSHPLAGHRHEEKMVLETRFDWLDSWYLVDYFYSGFPKETPELKFRLRFFFFFFFVQPQFAIL